MGGLSPVHIAIIVVVLLVVFGPKKLPELGRSLGSSLREFKKGTEGLAESVKSELSDSTAAVPEPAPGDATVVVEASAWEPVLPAPAEGHTDTQL